MYKNTYKHLIDIYTQKLFSPPPHPTLYVLYKGKQNPIG
jgi:hypothetical protein